MNKNEIEKKLIDRVDEMIEQDEDFCEKNGIHPEHVVFAHMQCLVAAATYIGLTAQQLVECMQLILEGSIYKSELFCEEIDGKIIMKLHDEYDFTPVGGIGIGYLKKDVKRIHEIFQLFADQIITNIEELSEKNPMRSIDWMSMMFYFACYFGKLRGVSQDETKEAFDINFNRALNDDELGILLPNSEILPEWFESEEHAHENVETKI